MGFEDFFSSLFGGQLGNIVSGVGGAAAQNKIITDIQEAGKQDFSTIFGTNYTPPAGGLIGEAKTTTEFKPFTVTTPTGSASTSATGTTFNLTPEQEAAQKAMFGFGADAFNFLGDPAQRKAEQDSIIAMLTQDPSQRAGREQDLYDRIRATQMPEEQRNALALEERLFNQGRSGVQTAMYGGTSEQLAQAKAVQEAQAGASIDAITQARLEQALGSEQTLAGLIETRNRLAQLTDTGAAALDASYLPQDKMIEALFPQLQASQISSALQSTGASLMAGLGESGLEAQLGYNALANALRQQQFQGLFDLLKGEQTAQTQAAAPAQNNSTLMNNLMGLTQQNSQADINAAIAYYGGIPQSGQNNAANTQAAIAYYGGIPT